MNPSTRTKRGRDALPAPRKYNNVPTEYAGRRYDSKAEAARARDLDLLVRGRAIRGWTPGPRFVVGGIEYRADFLVFDADGRAWAEDIKGVVTGKFRAVVQAWQVSGPCPLHVRARKETVIYQGGYAIDGGAA